ncbi:DUF4965 domain-containing protein [Aureibaculum algae]|uniref:DUF4965 domain-containing protein n=1 Tax=Aureibaculum algae TaxID=2584122 RepID=A0A5B7TR45_9FLAO|nr:DUF4965 domain-containing protein [Aureibaculum algae]QCX37427.1 DUF4965 domain-containing protein [Aureibaculum algae]
MKKKYFTLLFSIYTFISGIAQERQAPAYPLITHDPYFSIWSMGDEINSTTTRHWTNKPHSLVGMINVDGTRYRFLGKNAVGYHDVVPVSRNGKITEQKPGSGWEKNRFDDSTWKTAKAPYGNEGVAFTTWKTENLWWRKKFNLESINLEELFLKISHDDDVDVYLNGERVYNCEECWTDQNEYKYYPISNSIKAKLKKKNNILAIHVKNNRGGQWLNAGIVEKRKDKSAALQATQTNLNLSATQTSYVLTCGGVDVYLNFTTPALMDDLDLLSRPVSYISIKTVPNDNKKHEVQVFFGASSLIAANDESQMMIAQKSATEHLNYLKVGTKDQPVLEKKGDIIGIDWGYLYVATPKSARATQNVTSIENTKIDLLNGKHSKFQNTGKQLMLNTMFPKEKIDSPKEYLLLLGYDDLYSINYFGKNLHPWWNKDGKNSLPKELTKAFIDYEEIIKKCNLFDKELRNDALAAGGEKYAKLLEIGYRQSIAAHKLVESPDGEILFLSKENNSNGSINTVDVTYPSAPLFLIYNPDLLKGMLNGIFYYSESGKWKKPFPAHDIGTYPVATGQTYGEDMPIEEAGNMLALTAAITKAEGNASFAEKHWETITTWANYLVEEGLDPANQLCTDDFSGHLARNANLSIKAIVGVGGYGYMAKLLGKTNVADEYTKKAKTMAKQWMELADAGDHYALTFDDKKTWSQKYNLVWDKMIKLDLFPKKVYETELKFYNTKNNKYGLPLDNRSDYSKSDWILWTATLTNSKSDFQVFADPIYSFAKETKDRVPMSDWHWTTSGDMRGFKARSVVGGYFIKLLDYKWNNL